MNTKRLVELSRLLPDIITLLRRHMQTEWLLARREMSENLSRAGFGVGLYIFAGVCALVTVHALAAAAVIGLTVLEFSLLHSVLMVAGGFAIFTLIAVWMARGRLSSQALKPQRTLDQLRSDLAAVEEVLNARRDV